MECEVRSRSRKKMNNVLNDVLESMLSCYADIIDCFSKSKSATMSISSITSKEFFMSE